jgi:hypothetical protein
MFNVVDMEFSYNTVIGRGTLNVFKAVLHSAYLCMKIQSIQGVISVYGSQETTRREGILQEPKIVYNIGSRSTKPRGSKKDTNKRKSIFDGSAKTSASL